MSFVHKILWPLSTAELDVVSKCHRDVQFKCTLLSALVAVIVFISAYSAIFGFYGLFDNMLVALSLGLFSGWLILNVYRLFLISLNPVTPFRINMQPGLFPLVRLIALSGIISVSLLVATPININVHYELLQEKVKQLRQEKSDAFHERTNTFYEKRLLAMEEERAQFPERMTEQAWKAQRQALLNSRDYEMDKSRAYLNEANFFAQKAFLTFFIPSAWGVIGFSVFVFLLPILLSYVLNLTPEYKDRLTQHLSSRVISEYDSFKTHYTEAFQNQAFEGIVYHEPYLDPPFNELKKSKFVPTTSTSQGDFIENLYSDDD
jgi:hypothetical protein